MSGPTAIIYDNQTLFNCYQQLQKNDIICGRVRLKPGEEHLLTDLIARGVILIPSATSQVASRSKVFQARIFGKLMVPGTLPIYDLHDLLNASSFYRRQNYSSVILKCDRKNAGLGIHLFQSIEDLYNQVSGGGFPFPFVIQPFVEKCRDIRVILLGDYIEAYERTNPDNFRKNLHCGGTSVPYVLPAEQLDFCRQAMHRGAFDYAHIDLMLAPAGDCWLAEINLRGGLRGARICGEEYQRRVQDIHDHLVREAQRHS